MNNAVKTADLREVPAFTTNWVITRVGTNPKRKIGSPSWAAYELFFQVEGGTLADFAELHGKKWRSEIAWCVARGFIDIAAPVDAEVDAEA